MHRQRLLLLCRRRGTEHDRCGRRREKVHYQQCVGRLGTGLGRGGCHAATGGCANGSRGERAAPVQAAPLPAGSGLHAGRDPQAGVARQSAVAGAARRSRSRPPSRARPWRGTGCLPRPELRRRPSQCSRALGGSGSIQNLWPQRIANARQKDKLERRLRAAVCSGTLGLRGAQRRLRADWRAAYMREFRR